jgi:hypothetical protein
MSGVSRKSRQMTFEDLPKYISSLELEAGPLLSVSQGGQMIDVSELAHVPVSHIPQRDTVKATATKEISGPSCSLSCVSQELTRGLASRLRARFATVGSMEYVQTWKERVTPLGRSYSEHTARGVLISDKDFTGWPTPVANQANGTPEDFLRRKRESVARGHSMGICLTDLNMVAQLTGWPTPDSSHHGSLEPDKALARVTSHLNGGPKRSANLDDVAGLTGWPSPTSMSFDQSHQPGNNRYMNSVTDLTQPITGWVTPSSRDWKDTPGMSQTGVNPDGSTRERLDTLRRQVHGLTSESSTAQTGNRGVLNHLFSAWLMGFRIEHEIPSWFTCAPNFQSWVTVQKILSELSLKPSGIESEA